MAGQPLRKARAQAADAQIAELQNEIAKLRKRLKTDKRITDLAASRQINDETLPELIAELFEAADDGETLAEVAARWNLTEDEIIEAGKAHGLLGAALVRARIRAKARVHGMLRRAVEAGRGLPGAMVDRLLAIYEREDRATADHAAGLIRVHLNASQPTIRHCACCTGACLTEAESDAVSPGSGAA